MIRKLKLGASKLGAIAVIAAIGLVSSASAQIRADTIGKGALTGASRFHAFTLVACYDPSCTGGGSTGYNYHVAHDYRLKQRHVHHDLPSTTK